MKNRDGQIQGVSHNAIPWIRLEGQIDHAVAFEAFGWRHTACEIYTPGGMYHHEPQVKCGKCVERLKTAKLTPRGA